MVRMVKSATSLKSLCLRWKSLRNFKLNALTANVNRQRNDMSSDTLLGFADLSCTACFGSLSFPVLEPSDVPSGNVYHIKSAKVLLPWPMSYTYHLRLVTLTYPSDKHYP